jgi:hypothetical protein
MVTIAHWSGCNEGLHAGLKMTLAVDERNGR